MLVLCTNAVLWIGTYRGRENGKESLVYFTSVIWLILLLVVSDKCHPRVGVSFWVVCDTILKLTDFVVWKAMRQRC